VETVGRHGYLDDPAEIGRGDSMDRTFVILRHTFKEAVAQPIFTVILLLGTAILIVFGALPFFTLGDDTTMFKAVGLDVVLILVLIATLFATSRSIFEEIEDRTMLTLMSKPVQRWQVLLGKYLGLISASAVSVAVLGVVLAIATYLRIPNDYMINPSGIDDIEQKMLADYRASHLAGLYPSLVMVWLQIAALAAVSVAISTRVSLVVNLPVVILLYFAGNLTRFIDAAVEGRSLLTRGVAYVASLAMPFLEVFDLRERSIYGMIAVPGTRYENAVGAATLGEIWGYAGYAAVYGAAYATFALALGLLLFRSRELGGAEG
jgi:ABC-type transport system involved in multi-copper enzyme maturation permease subunit